MADKVKKHFATDETLSEKMAELIEATKEVAQAVSGEADTTYLDDTFAAMLDDTNTTEIFKEWWRTGYKESMTRTEMMTRWFKMLALNNNKTQTVRFYSPSSGVSDSRGCPLADLANHKAQALYTDSGVAENANQWVDAEGNNRTDGEDWATEDRQTWYIRVNGIPNATEDESGNPLKDELNIIAVEGEDADFDITGITAPVYVLQANPYFVEVDDGVYLTKSWRLQPAEGYKTFNNNDNPDGTRKYFTYHPCTGGVLIGSGSAAKLSSGMYHNHLLWTTAEQGHTYAQKMSKYASVAADSNAKWALYEWQRRHFNLENSNIAEGCTNYNLQCVVAVAEENTKRVIVSKTNGANFVVGSNVIVGTRYTSGSSVGNDRNYSQLRSLSVTPVRITAIEPVTVDGTEYTALYLDLSTEITTVAEGEAVALTYISTVAWDTGETEALPEHQDGSPVNLTNGKYPIRVAGMELLTGTYFAGLDVLYKVTANATSGFDYAVYECLNPANFKGSITSNYIDTGITYTGLKSGWQSLKEYYLTTKPILFPKTIGGSTSTYLKSSVCGSYAAGVRSPWRFGDLGLAGYAGLACVSLNGAPSGSHWHGCPWLTASDNLRGE